MLPVGLPKGVKLKLDRSSSSFEYLLIPVAVATKTKLFIVIRLSDLLPMCLDIQSGGLVASKWLREDKSRKVTRIFINLNHGIQEAR